MHYARLDLDVQIGAMAAWATFNVNRNAGVPWFEVWQVIPQFKALFGAKAREAALAAPAAAPSAPSKPQQMRLPKQGERPPSRFAPGVPDNVIEKFDAYARRAHGVTTPYNQRR